MNDNFDGPCEVRNRWKKTLPNNGEPTEGEWNQIRKTVLMALLPFDDARKAVRSGLRALNQLPEEGTVDG